MALFGSCLNNIDHSDAISLGKGQKDPYTSLLPSTDLVGRIFTEGTSHLVQQSVANFIMFALLTNVTPPNVFFRLTVGYLAMPQK